MLTVNTFKTIKSVVKGISGLYRSAKYLTENRDPVIKKVSGIAVQNLKTITPSDINNFVPVATKKIAEIETRIALDIGTSALIAKTLTKATKTIKGLKKVEKIIEMPKDPHIKGGSDTFKSNEEAMKYYSNLVEKLNVNTGKNQAVFYSGPGNRQLAEQFAKENGKLTLEMTPGGKYLDNLKLFDSNSPLTGDQAAEIWGKLSKRYADNASGTAFGFTQGFRPGSIFNTVEYPALEVNKNIVNVITEFFKK